MEKSNDEAIMNFMAATGTTDVDIARRYIEMSGGELNSAVALYFEMSADHGTGGVDTAAVGSEGVGAGCARSYSPPSGTAATSSDEKSPGAPRRGRRGGRGTTARGNGRRSPSAADEETIPAFNEKLLDARDRGSLQLNYGSASSQRVAPGNTADYGLLAQQFTDFSSEGDKAFTELFAPPVGLVSSEPFETALARAKREGLLLLVNIQTDDEFASHNLNRDVWRDDTICEILRSNFIFWQRNQTSSEGAEFVLLYKVLRFPHICVVDPRTGRQMKSWTAEKFSDSTLATSELIHFMETWEARCQNRSSSKSADNRSLAANDDDSGIRPSGDSVSESGRNEEVHQTQQRGPKRSKVAGDAIKECLKSSEGSAEEYGNINATLANLRKERELRNRA